MRTCPEALDGAHWWLPLRRRFRTRMVCVYCGDRLRAGTIPDGHTRIDGTVYRVKLTEHYDGDEYRALLSPVAAS